MAKLNLGCGKDRKDGYINIDINGGDVQRDVLRGLPFDSDSIDEVFSENFLEHIPQTEVIFVMNEIHRVLKEGGISHHFVPVANSVNFNQDPTHLSHWNEEGITYYLKGHRRNDYYGNLIKPYELVKLETINDLMEFILKK